MATTKRAMVVMEGTVEERTQSERTMEGIQLERTMEGTQSKRSYTTTYGRLVATTERAMTAMERIMEE